MGEPMKKTSCQIACWAMGAAAGFVAFVMLMALGGWSVMQALFGAGVIFLVLGGLLSWILCKPLPHLSELRAGMGAGAGAAAPRAQAPVAAKPVAEAPVADTPVAAAPAAAAPVAAPSAGVRAGTLLAGESELAARKGSWSYQAPAAAAAPAPAPAAAAAPATAAAATGVKPATLTAPRDGKADNLRAIKGVGPKLEVMLNGMGFYHYDQIAAWTPAELAWVDQNLEGFKGRASRDNWVAQAALLASGRA
jgi:predicted flap endonuclease-1-like 5' DNA nuclease